MLQYRIRVIMLAVVIVLSGSSTVLADTWRLEKGRDWKPASAKVQDKYLLAVARTKKFVDKTQAIRKAFEKDFPEIAGPDLDAFINLLDTGQTKEARKAFDKLKEKFPKIPETDLGAFIKADIEAQEFSHKGKYAKAARTYKKLLTEHPKLLDEYPESELCKAILVEQFRLAALFLAGQKKTVLGVFKIKGYAEGTGIMEKIDEHAGLDEPNGIGIEAAKAVAESYREREQFNLAYLKWWDISLNWDWETSQIGKEALLNMAQCKRAVYNKHPAHKRTRYDTSNLKTARTHYETYSKYLKDAKEIEEINKILKEIKEQLIYKQFITGRYYQNIGNTQAANLYYRMVIDNWYNKFESQHPEDAQEFDADEILKHINGQLADKPGPDRLSQKTGNKNVANFIIDNWPESKTAKMAEMAMKAPKPNNKKESKWQKSIKTLEKLFL